MENKNLEKLFRNKLEGMVIEPSAEARDTFSRSLRSANRRILIRKLSIAATILLLLSSGAVFLLQNDKVAKVNLVDKEVNRDVNENTHPGEKHILPAPAKEDEAGRTEYAGQTVDRSFADNIVSDERESGVDPATRNENERGNAIPYTQERNIIEQSIRAGTYALESEEIHNPAKLDNKTAGINNYPNEPVDTAGFHGTTSKEYLASSGEEHSKQNSRSQTGQHDGHMDPTQSGPAEENRHIEYYIETQVEGSEAMITSRDPMKITIEYKVSGSNKEKSQSRLKEFYSRIDNVKGMDEVIGDIRTYKDRLFTLDFKNREKVNNDQ